MARRQGRCAAVAGALPAGSGKRLSWSDDAKTAANYLLSRQDKMAYKTYKARGWPIGSGQIEGMNKSVIGKRMKQSGMEWSRAGAGRMAALRASLASQGLPKARSLARYLTTKGFSYPRSVSCTRRAKDPLTTARLMR